jgi:hypothetical protein
MQIQKVEKIISETSASSNFNNTASVFLPLTLKLIL